MSEREQEKERVCVCERERERMGEREFAVALHFIKVPQSLLRHKKDLLEVDSITAERLSICRVSARDEDEILLYQRKERKDKTRRGREENSEREGGRVRGRERGRKRERSREKKGMLYLVAGGTSLF